ILMALDNLVDAGKQPYVDLMVEVGKREDVPAIEAVHLGPILLPTLPVRRITYEDVQRLVNLVPFSEMDLIVGEIVDTDNIFKLNRHYSLTRYIAMRYSTIEPYICLR